MKVCILSLAILVLVSACHKFSAGSRSAPNNVADSTDLVLRISGQSRLHVVECKVHKVLTHQDLLQWEATIPVLDFKKNIIFGNRKIAIPIDVSLQVYIDFSGFSHKHVKRQEDHIHILLPNPRIVVSSSRIDHNGIKQYAGLIRQEYTDQEMTQITRQGVQDILKEIPRTDLLKTAQLNAGAVLIPLLSQLGYPEEYIRITFMDRPEELTLEQLYDNEGSTIKLGKEETR